METEKVKKIYNEIVKNKFKGDYEHNRWFKDERYFSGYKMTKSSIENYFLKDITFAKYLELGPGAGTWTKLFLEKNSQGELDLVDISGEMLALAKGNLKNWSNINFFEADFFDFQTIKKYDSFFSSRVMEYFPNKGDLIRKINELLEPGGRGFIITKMPKYFFYKLAGKKVPEMHQDQIRPEELEHLLSENGFIDISVYPAVIVVPLFKSIILDKIFFNIFKKFKLNFFSKIFSESYCVKFKKK